MSCQFNVEFDLSEEQPRAIVTFSELGDSDFGQDLRAEMDHLLDEGIRDFEIDLRHINSCNSITLGTFVGLQATVKRYGGQIAFTLLRGTYIRRMFTTLKLDQVLQIKEVKGVVDAPVSGRLAQYDPIEDQGHPSPPESDKETQDASDEASSIAEAAKPRKKNPKSIDPSKWTEQSRERTLNDTAGLGDVEVQF